MEPEQSEKRDAAARKLFEGGQKSAHVPETVSIDELKERLKKVRRYARDNISSLIEELKTTLGEKYPGLKVKSAADYIDAANYITEIADGVSTVSTNNSSSVTQELKTKLEENGFTVVNSYINEFEVGEKKVRDYWDLPRLTDRNIRGTFDVVLRMDGLPATGDARKYLAVLGLNSISAEDGTTFFLEHFSNIHKDLRLAGKVVLVVGLDKIVKTRQEAAFQTQCMGIFGMESVLLGIEPKAGEIASIENLSLPPDDKERELHLIILDNGRSQLLEGKYSDLFLCIGCRACNKHCPIRHSFTNVDYIWTPKTYLTQFLYGTGRSVDVCLHCEACHIECPVDIDLPYMMWQAKLDYVVGHGTSFYHRMLGRPELLARLGTAFAPIANRAMRQKLIRAPMELITGIDRKTKLPTFHHNTFRKRFKKHG